MNAPPCGEVWLVDLGMVATVRPAVVVSVPAGPADRALVTFVPHTTSVRSTAYEVPIRVPFLKPGAFDVQGRVSIPFAKLERRLGRLSSDQLRTVDAALRAWLSLGASNPLGGA